MADPATPNDVTPAEGRDSVVPAASAKPSETKLIETKAETATKPALKAQARISTKRKPAARKPAAAAASVNRKDKMMNTNTNTNTNTTTDYRQTVADAGADVQNRVRAAYERSTEMTGEMTEFAKGNVEAMVESGRIFAAGVQEIARTEMAAVKSVYETMTEDMRQMAAVKSPAELLQLQGEIMRRNFDAMIKHGSKNTENMVRVANDAFAPLSTRMSLAAEKVAMSA